MDNTAYKTLRLQLLLFATLRGMVLWYAIEKLFQAQIGITAPQIVILGILAQASKAFLELPTSIFADRSSRRNILIVAFLAMVSCELVLGSANSFEVYIIGAVLWSVSDALTSGVYEAFAYDTLATGGWKKHFKSVYTRMRSLELSTLAVVGAASGFISHFVGLRAIYFISIIPATLTVLFLLRFKEPPILRNIEASNWLHHTKDAMNAMKEKSIRWPIMLYIFLIGMQYIWFEYYQLVGLDVHVPQLWFGFLIAAATMGMAFGAELAHLRAASKSTIAVLWLLFLGAHMLGLRLSSISMALAVLFLIFTTQNMLRIYLELFIHEKIDSQHRATLFSLANTASYLVFFVMGLLFSELLQKQVNVRSALSLVSLPILLFAVLDLVKKTPWATNKVADEKL